MNSKASSEWLDQPGGGKFALSLVAGLALEAAVLALLLPHLKPSPPPAQTQARVQLTIAAPPAPKPPPQPKPQPKPQPLPPPPVPPQPAAAPTPMPRPRLAPHPAVHHAVRAVAPRPVAPQPVAPAMPVPPAPAAPPQPAAPSAGQVDLFRDAVRRAVQQVANSVYPQGVQQGGSAVITIDYLNGRVLDVTLARSSGVPVLDAAALQAGRIADYPPPPPAFANHRFPWTVTVVFGAAAPVVDSD